MTESTWAIETFDLTKRFPSARFRPFSRRPSPALAVDRVSIQVRGGELFGLLGPNGAGKTTLIKLLCTLITPTAGSARVNGFDLCDEQQVKGSIGLVTSDERSFFWRLTGRENLNFFATLHNLDSAQRRRRVGQALAQVGLESVADDRFQVYSTGMRQRLAIARALLSNPLILFLDEPSKGLDPTATLQLHDLIRKQLVQEQGMTVFLCTHILPEAEKLCDRIAIIQRGRIRACGTMPELRRSLGLVECYQVRAGALGENALGLLRAQFPEAAVVDRGGGEAQIEFERLDDEELLNQVIDSVRACGGKIRLASREAVSLETIFARVTGAPADPAASEQVAAPPPPTIFARTRTVRPPDPYPHPSLLLGLEKLAAFLVRDARQDISYRVSFFFQFFSIGVAVTMFYFASRLLGSVALPFLQPYGGNLFAFILIGIAFLGYFDLGLSSFGGNLRTAQSMGTLEAMLTSPTHVFLIITASSLWNYALTTIRVICYLVLGGLALGLDLGRANFLAAAFTLMLTIFAFSGIGIWAASFIMVLKRGEPVTWLFGSASTLLGGVYFPPTVLPSTLQVLSTLFPITYALHAMRLALLQGAPFQTLWPDLIALTIFGTVLLPSSLIAFRFAVNWAKADGSLTHY